MNHLLWKLLKQGPHQNERGNKTKQKTWNIQDMSSGIGERCWKSLDNEEGEAQGDSCAPGVGGESRSCQTSVRLKSNWQCHFCYILLAKASHKTSPDSVQEWGNTKRVNTGT